MLASQPGGLRFELVHPDGSLEGRDDPFTTLSDAGRFSRVYLARAALGPASLRLVALKVRRPAPRTGDPAPTNAAVDERWDRELATLRATSSPDVVRFLDPGSEEDRGRPVTFCRKVKRSFHPMCPTCLGPLRDCRDDALLRSAGLPAYSEGAARYLACAKCAPNSPVFYSESPAPEGATAEVRSPARLARDGGAILRADVSADTRVRLERDFACYACDHREECYSEGTDPSTPVPAESLLVPFSFHDLQAIPMEVLPLGYGEFADLLGGAEWPAVRARALLEPGASGRETALAALDASFASAPLWFHRNDRTGRFPLEVLRLKLALFGQAARGVKSVQEASGRAILGLGPPSVMVETGASGADLPALWSFRAKVIDVGGEDPGPDGAAPAVDLRGLARLYFRALLVNDAQDEAAAEGAVARVAERLRSSFPDGGAPADPKSVADLLRVLFEAEAQAFDRSSPLYAMAAREAKENLIPPGLWSDLLIFGFRLEVPIPGFGFAPPPEGAMAGPVERALADFEVLLGRVQVELTGRADRGREIQRVCDALMTEFAVAAPGGAPARSSDSTRVR
jgi:hypothetical protein